MNIEEALKKIPFQKRAYFRYKFDLPYYRFAKKFESDEEFLEHIGRKSILSFHRWERTIEYKQLVAIYLQSKSASDLLDIYRAIVEKAKKGDGKAVDTLLKLQKEIKQIAKGALKNDIDTGDDLEL